MEPVSGLTFLSRSRDQEKWSCFMFKTTLPHLFTHLDASDLCKLRLRLVNKSFQITVDNFLRNAEPFRRMDPQWDKRPKLNLTKFLNPWQEEYSLDQLVYEMRSLQNVNIIGGAMYIKLSLSSLDCRPFLKEFGSKIVHLWLCLSPNSEFIRDQTEVMAFIRDVLKSTPNLATLKLQASAEFRDYTPVPNFWTENSPPNLPKLEYLSMELEPQNLIWECTNSNYYVYTMHSLITAYSSQIRCLNVYLTENVNLSVDMPLLQNLELGAVIHVKELTCLSAPILQRINVIKHPFHSLSHTEILLSLQRFRDTLTHVHISSFRGKENRSSEPEWIDMLPEKVDLPNLKELYMSDLSGRVDEEFPFLFNFPKLRCLELEFEEPVKIIKLTGYLFDECKMPKPTHFYRSCIWDRLPYLQKLCVKARGTKVDCYRRIYEYLERRKERERKTFARFYAPYINKTC